jgi:hypothetical protein
MGGGGGGGGGRGPSNGPRITGLKRMGGEQHFLFGFLFFFTHMQRILMSCDAGVAPPPAGG